MQNDRPSDSRDGSPPPMPTWVKVSGIAVIIVLVVVIVLHVMGRGFGGHT